MSQEDPPRLLLQDTGAPPELRRALDLAIRDVPTPEHVEVLLARMPPLPPGGGGGDGAPGDAGGDGGPSDGALPDGALPDGGLPDGGALPGAPDLGSIAPAAAATSGWAKLIGVGAVGAALLAGTYVATRDAPRPSTVASATARPSAAAPATVAPIPPPAASAATAAPTASALATAAPHGVAPPPSGSATARPEIEILREAQAALAGSPARALALAEEHARSHPRGNLGQEREMVRIQALVALGKKEEARAAARAFKERHPGSAYTQRIDDVVK